MQKLNFSFFMEMRKCEKLIVKILLNNWKIFFFIIDDFERYYQS